MNKEKKRIFLATAMLLSVSALSAMPQKAFAEDMNTTEEQDQQTEVVKQPEATVSMKELTVSDSIKKDTSVPIDPVTRPESEFSRKSEPVKQPKTSLDIEPMQSMSADEMVREAPTAVDTFELIGSENEQTIGTFNRMEDVFKEITRRKDKIKDFKIVLKKDYEYEENEDCKINIEGLKVSILSALDSRFTLKKRGGDYYHFIITKGGNSSFLLKNVILDGNGGKGGIEAGNQDDSKPAEIELGEGAVIQNCKHEGFPVLSIGKNVRLTIDDGAVIRNNESIEYAPIKVTKGGSLYMLGSSGLSAPSGLPVSSGLSAPSGLSGSSGLQDSSALSVSSDLSDSSGLPGSSDLSVSLALSGSSDLSGSSGLPGSSGLSGSSGLPVFEKW